MKAKANQQFIAFENYYKLKVGDENEKNIIQS